jgi:glycosyltransferase involved in cell wall biosynthesis
MKSIGLCMIVRNEAPVIRRCLESMLPLIDYVLIVDTGSTDATRTVVRDFLSEKNIAGEVIDEPWQNFAYNRTFALRKLREKRQIDYSLRSRLHCRAIQGDLEGGFVRYTASHRKH